MQETWVQSLVAIPGSERVPGEGNGLPTTVLLHGKSHGERSLVGYCPWDCKESDPAEATELVCTKWG